TTCQLLEQRRDRLENIIVVSESGLQTPDDLKRVADAGAKAVLIGEAFMKQPDPGEALAAIFPE
ncbi:MAG: indole-3-glycerol phosphate synthase TrpC, partial [Chroococcales cyanobacterium]